MPQMLLTLGTLFQELLHLLQTRLPSQTSLLASLLESAQALYRTVRISKRQHSAHIFSETHETYYNQSPPSTSRKGGASPAIVTTATFPTQTYFRRPLKQQTLIQSPQHPLLKAKTAKNRKKNIWGTNVTGP